MNLVQDHVAHTGKHLPSPGVKQNDGEAFRGQGKDGWGQGKKASALRLRRVPGAGLHPYGRKRLACFLKPCLYSFQGQYQIPPNVFVQGFKGRNVKYRKPVGRVSSLDKTGNGRKETCKSFAAPRRRDGKNMLSLCDKGPCLFLHWGRFPVSFGKPGVYQGVKGKWHIIANSRH
jgi:hypothetical protein